MKVQQEISADGVSVQNLPPPELSAKAELLSAIALFQAALDGVPADLPAESAADPQPQARSETQPLVRDMSSPLSASPVFGSALAGSALADLPPQSGTGNRRPLSASAVAVAMAPASVRAAVSSEDSAQAATDDGIQGDTQPGLHPRRQAAPALAPSLTGTAAPAPLIMPVQSEAVALPEIAGAQARSDQGVVIGGAAAPSSHVTAVPVVPLSLPATQVASASPDRVMPGALSAHAVPPIASPQSSGIAAASAHDAGDAGDDISWEMAGASTGTPLTASGSVSFANFRANEGGSNSGQRAATVSEPPRVPQSPSALTAASAGATHAGLTTGVTAAAGAPISVPIGGGAVDMAGSPAREMAISIPSLPGTTLYASVQNGQLAMQVVSSNASFVSQLRSLLPEIESAFNRLAGRSVQISASLRRGGPLPAEGEPAELRADAEGVNSDEDPDTQTA
ncbi:MAG: hypothetical protein Q7T63_01870 [Burkholderiaceae bacterium]|nr:hypothetical protein [Burkholderiaceae bacterium]